MSFEFTTEGLTIQTFQGIFDELAVGYRAIYGNDINLDPDSPDGQRVGIEAKSRLDLQSALLNLYNQIDPDFATGEIQKTILKIAGITVNPPSKSQVDVTITTDRIVTLPTGYTVEDDSGQNWVTDEVIALVNGANAVTMVAEDFGVVSALPGEVNNPITIVIGVVSVTNALASTVGRDEETEEEVRIRRNKSLQNPAYSVLGGVTAKLADLGGVTDIAAYENDTKTFDAVRNIDPNTIWLVVEGGEIANIIEIIAKHKTGGTGIKGSVAGTYIETIIKPDGSTIDLTHSLLFDRPAGIPLYLTLTVQGTNGAIVDVAAIKNALAKRPFSINESVTAGNLYRTVYSVADNFTATLLLISDDGITFTDGILDPGLDGVFSIDILNIDITDIT